MLRLTHCKFEGLQGFEKLELADLNALTIFVGPNGAGKSTILRVIALAFSILNKRTLCDVLPNHMDWDRFSLARLSFKQTEFVPIPLSTEFFGGTFNEISEIVVEITCDKKQFLIRSIRLDEQEIVFTAPKGTQTDITNKRKEIAALQSQKSNQEKQNTPQSNPQQRQQISAQIAESVAEIGRKNTELDELCAVAAQASNAESPTSLKRDEVDTLLGGFGFPILEYVDARQLHEKAIPTLITKLLEEKKGRKQSHMLFAEAMDRLSHLLQADVDVSEVDGKEELHINGAPYQRSSSGTQISLSFFGLTRLGEPGCIILWDEPENGLHPTRRARLLDLMFSDGRQFVLATHAAEFAPVFSENGKVFRCASSYDEDNTEVKLSVALVADRRGAFETLEA
jgi:AAA15 family ATPase/GTPase